MKRREKKDINGVILLNKPLGLSSNAALQKVKRLFHARKAGHTGSLDPLATGMLPICFGEATKYCQYLLDADKCYRVTARLGISTSTGDAEGEVIRADHDFSVQASELESVLEAFTTTIAQVPPMYSALKHQGQPLYKLARQGVVIERKARKVTIHDIKLLNFDGHDFNCVVTCSKGTYIRTLIEDIGQALGLGAHVASLHRVYSAPYAEETMVTMAELERCADLGDNALQDHLLSVASMTRGYPAVTLDTDSTQKIRHGQVLRLSPDATAEQGLLQLFDQQQNFIGLAECDQAGVLSAKRLIREAPASGL